MRQATRTSRVLYAMLFSLLVVLGASLVLPVRTGDRRHRSPSAEQMARRALEGARYAALIDAADADFGQRRFASARRQYEAIAHDPLERRFGFGIVRDKIAATYVAEGDYLRALAAYRHAEFLPPNTSRSDDGTRKAQMVLLAYRRGDEATFATLMGEFERRENSGPPLPVPKVSAEDQRATRNPAAFRRLGRIFASAHHRAGAEFAYDRALALTQNAPIISDEWARLLGSAFHDAKAELRVLRTSVAGSNPDRGSDIERRIRTLEYRVKGVSADSVQNRLAQERWSEFQGRGVYDPEASLLVPGTDVAINHAGAWLHSARS